MLVVTRYRLDPDDAHAADDLVAAAGTALLALAARPGCRSARLARATDDPSLWLLTSEWDGAGSYRRALSSYEVKVDAVPLLSRCLDEPTAFEVLADVVDGGLRTHTGDLAPDAATAAPGRTVHGPGD